MRKIAFIGIPGSGKTTLTRRLATELSLNHNVEIIEEFARSYISKLGGIESVTEQFLITEKQIQREEHIKADILITDSPVFQGFNYLNDLISDSKKDSFYVTEIFKRIYEYNIESPYDIVFHIPPDIKPNKDGVRPDLHFDREWRQRANTVMKALPFIFGCKIVHEIKDKNIDKRIQECEAVIATHLYKNEKKSKE